MYILKVIGLIVLLGFQPKSAAFIVEPKVEMDYRPCVIRKVYYNETKKYLEATGSCIQILTNCKNNSSCTLINEEELDYGSELDSTE